MLALLHSAVWLNRVLRNCLHPSTQEGPILARQQDWLRRFSCWRPLFLVMNFMKIVRVEYGELNGASSDNIPEPIYIICWSRLINDCAQVSTYLHSHHKCNACIHSPLYRANKNPIRSLTIHQRNAFLIRFPMNNVCIYAGTKWKLALCLLPERSWTVNAHQVMLEFEPGDRI